MTAFREKFEQSISNEMKLTRRMFFNILACDISTSGYADRVLSKLEAVGCVRAREYYKQVKDDWQRKHDESMNNVAEWYKKQGSKEEGGVNTNWKKMKEAELMKADLHKKSDRQLLILLQNMQ